MRALGAEAVFPRIGTANPARREAAGSSWWAEGPSGAEPPSFDCSVAQEVGISSITIQLNKFFIAIVIDLNTITDNKRKIGSCGCHRTSRMDPSSCAANFSWKAEPAEQAG